ncbi:UV DNA damage repair endonuclease UvsE [soil metagenome]
MTQSPHLGLVCITQSDAVRYRTVTRTRYLSFGEDERYVLLDELYRHNLGVLFKALDFCRDHAIRLYRVNTNLFPLNDWEDGIGWAVLGTLAEHMAEFGPRADALHIRVLVHPEQYVVLNSLRPEVIVNSVRVLESQALIFDRLGLPRSAWAGVNIHGGKGGRSDELVETIAALPDGVRSRLTLENDEHAYSAAAILDVCERAGVPMVFDAHHHVVSEGLTSLEDASVSEYTHLARTTWQPPHWQVVHLSNGRTGVNDSKHSDLIETVPSAFREVNWIEVEAKSKEEAIFGLRNGWVGGLGRG